MSLYHASFTGRRDTEYFQPLRKVAVVLEADSIYDVEDLVKARYEFVTGLCVTNCEWIDRTLYEVAA